MCRRRAEVTDQPVVGCYVNQRKGRYDPPAPSCTYGYVSCRWLGREIQYETACIALGMASVSGTVLRLRRLRWITISLIVMATLALFQLIAFSVGGYAGDEGRA